jgi:hypothetical protein
MRYKGDEKTINLTSNPDCPNCKKKTIHTVRNWKKYHPNSRTGISNDRRLAGG